MSASSLTVADSSPAAGSGLVRSPVAVAPIVLGAVVLAFATLPLDRAVVAAFAAAVLVLVSAIDLERGIIPNRIVLPAAGIVLLAQIALFPGQAFEWVVAA